VSGGGGYRGGRIDVHSPFFGPSGVSLTTGSVGSETATWRDETFQTLHKGLDYQAIALASYVATGRTESPLRTLDVTVWSPS
jgi:hypothetical protein